MTVTVWVVHQVVSDSVHQQQLLCSGLNEIGTHGVCA